ncbi:HNH endonuclease signature motif containing protein [Nocardioides psychrotolerans]|uniref:HNH endonuclease signature motif containing protein n=1 Tax=Nocardioides psychrotolerans TaxID=1005945 RepID=UPI0014797966|nr:HNH endonuclease signature motif containing protein [Nocardioides psychrotolerans]
MKAKNPCTIDGCDLVQYGRGWCENHYARWRRHGSTHDKRAESRDARVRFEERVDRTTTPLGCHLWQGPPNGSGYGYFNLNGRSVGAHVAACLLAGVDVPSGYEPDHLCRVPLCVRMDHLEVVTAAENKRRAASVRWGKVSA